MVNRGSDLQRILSVEFLIIYLTFSLNEPLASQCDIFK